jgi:hypothetical protein
MTPQKTPNILMVEDQLNWRRLLKVWLNKEFQLTFHTNQSKVNLALKKRMLQCLDYGFGIYRSARKHRDRQGNYETTQ